MARQTFEDLVPGLAEMRARERENRAIAFAYITRTVCGREIRAMTPRDRLDLQNLGNAFTHALEPLEGDVFVFLWILDPRRRRGSGPLAAALNSWRQFWLRRHVKRLNLQAAIRSIRIYLVAQLQDTPEHGTEGTLDQSPWVHWIAADASFWMNRHGGFTLETYLATPYPVLQQLYRGWRCNNPPVRVEKNGSIVVEEPQFINASDRLIGEWHAERKEEVKRMILAQKHRLN